MDRFQAFMISLRNKVPLDFQKLQSISNDYGNWVIPGHVMCGPFPGFDNVNFTSEAEARDNISKIIVDGVDVFVCLQEEEAFHQGLPSYASLWPATFRGKCLHYPIEDHKIPQHAAFLAHVNELLQLILDGHILYIHCLGGHGRTGTYVACLLMILYGLTAKHALFYTQTFHNLRRKIDKRCPGIFPCMSPENDVQIEFVHNFEAFLKFVPLL